MPPIPPSTSQPGSSSLLDPNNDDEQAEAAMSWYRSASQKDVLEDLASRFIVNLPTFELSSVERVCFQVEQAHWYYEDFVRPSNEKLPTIPLRKFTALMFKASELPYDPDEAFDTWMEYKTEVPVCGAIMLNDAMDKCVLVRGYKSASWTFPKGKLNQNEDTWHCACREVLEETGYHLAAKIQPDSVVTINHQGRQEMTMFIVTGVEEDASMLTRTRKEIDDIRWFRIDDLPHAGDRGKGHGGGKFYLVVPFMHALRKFVAEHRPSRPKKLKTGRQAKRKPDARALRDSGDASDTPYQDVNHDASSAASSAENGDPHTPSPQCSESIANPVAIVRSGDEHIDRLFGSLCLNQAEPVSSPAKNASYIEAASPDSPTPVPLPSSNTSVRRDDTSVTPSAPSPRPPPQSVTNGVSTFRSESAHHLQSAQRSYHSAPVQCAETMVHSEPARTNPASLSPVSPQSSRSPPASPKDGRKPTQRRTSSKADISPYLSRPTVAVSSPKSMVQLSLLESVAQDAERQAMKRPGTVTPPPNQARSSFIPVPPASVPPPPVVNDPRVLYTSGAQMVMALPPSSSQYPGPSMLHGPSIYGPPPQMSGYAPIPFPPVPSAPVFPVDDPFQVRPRSSFALHRPGSMFNLQPHASTLDQTQLMDIINAGRSPTVAPPGTQFSYGASMPVMHQPAVPSQAQPYLNSNDILPFRGVPFAPFAYPRAQPPSSRPLTMAAMRPATSAIDSLLLSRISQAGPVSGLPAVSATPAPVRPPPDALLSILNNGL